MKSLVARLPVVLTIMVGWCGIGVAAERQATLPESIRAREGFRVELLRSAQEDEGSWISMTFDPAGRVIVGLDDHGLARLAINNETGEATFERIAGTESLLHVRGVLYAHDSIYVSATNSQGIYRIQDLGESFQMPERIQELKYDSRYGHGTNQITLGPDNSIYFVIGNDVVFPPSMSDDSPYRDPQNDWLLPSRHDGGHDSRVGYIAKVDPEGKTWEVVAGGFRNQVDVAFNQDGEMFTWDADMEWDIGLPWYRPTRLSHVVSGGEYGWRWGTGKWPNWFPDSLPATLDTGMGSPTGMVFGHLSNWPRRYREALFMADWQFGRILTVDTKPRGASYEAAAQWFLEGGPLNVCDLTFGPDGALYFITGGRGSQSGLYRVTWTGDEDDQEIGDDANVDASARELRRQLEVYHRKVDPSAVDFIWDQLNHADPSIRYAARIALENQPVATWRDRIAAADDSLGLHTALLALARVGQATDQAILIDRISDFKGESDDWGTSETDPWILPLRALQISLIRQGLPNSSDQQRLVELLEPLFPQKSFATNWLVQELLVKLRSPHVLAKSLDLLESASTQEEQFQYAKTMSHIDWGWDRGAAARMLNWLRLSRNHSGGKLVETAWNNLRGDFISLWSDSLRSDLAIEIANLNMPRPEGFMGVPSPRSLVRNWSFDDLIDSVNEMRPEDRSVEGGEKALVAGLCLRCHRLGERGSPVGPDLSQVGKRLDGRALLESIVDPSRQVDPKYYNSSFLMNDGRIVSGRTVGVSKGQLTIETDPMTGRTEAIDRSDIEMSLKANRSPMPDGLLDTLTLDEVLDLIALLRR